MIMSWIRARRKEDKNKNYSVDHLVFFFIIIINMDVRISLYAPRLIPRVLKLATM
jgi:hypothetical protein